MVDDQAARIGILKFLRTKGDSLNITELHGFSKIMHQAAHQDFSRIMEGLVGDGLVTYEDPIFQLTDQGRVVAESHAQ